MAINLDEIFAQSSLDIRPARLEDQEFLERVFFSTREDLLLLNLPASILQPMLRQQYRLQQHAYAERWPHANYCVIGAMGLPVGKVMLAPSTDAIHIVDIAFLPEMRGRGMGQSLIKIVQAAALQHGLAISLSVDHQNRRARKFYETLGFRVKDTSETHDFMRWNGAC